MQTAVNSIDSSSKSPNTIRNVNDTICVERSTDNELLAMDLPTILLSTGLSNAEHATADVLRRLESEFGCELSQHSNVEAMSVTPSPQGTPSKKRRHRTNLQFSVANSDNSNNISSSSSSSTSEISVINNVAKNATKNGCALQSSFRDSAAKKHINNSCEAKLLQIPPKTLSIIAYGDQYYAQLSDSGNSEVSTPLAPSTTTSIDSSYSSSTISTPNGEQKLDEKCSNNLELLDWKDMPRYLQFNPYVLHGYRPLQPFRGCLLSLFYWHNETVNILTHAIPIFYILATVPGLMPWENEFRFLSFCHLLGSVAPWCGSFAYHLFMNIENGESIYYRLLKFDMVGIWVSQSFGALPLVTATTFCFGFKLKWAIRISYCLLSLWGLYKALTAKSPWQRRLCFALPFTMRSILTVLRTFGLVGGTRVALSHVYLQLEVDGVSILGGAIGAMRIPEKWFPGLVDYYLNSHNIMHVLVVLAVYSMHKATLKDFEWMSTASCDEFNSTTSRTIESALNAHIEL